MSGWGTSRSSGAGTLTSCVAGIYGVPCATYNISAVLRLSLRCGALSISFACALKEEADEDAHNEDLLVRKFHYGWERFGWLPWSCPEHETANKDALFFL